MPKKTNHDRWVGCRMPGELYAMLSAEAEASGLPVAAVIRSAVRGYVARAAEVRTSIRAREED